MDVYPAQKAIYVMEVQIQTNLNQLLNTMVKFVQKGFIALKAPGIRYPVRLALLTPSKVWQN
jgi:hypothetical protein